MYVLLLKKENPGLHDGTVTRTWTRNLFLLSSCLFYFHSYAMLIDVVRGCDQWYIMYPSSTQW